MMASFILISLPLLLALLKFSRAWPSESKVVKVNVTMRDGVGLSTVVVLPEGYKSGQKFPTIMDRSPYGYPDLEWIADIFVPFGYVAIGQDVRGTEKSGGSFFLYMNEGNDSQDCGDWIVSQEWSNGQVYSFGASADGINSFQTLKNRPSWFAGQYVAWAPARLTQILFPFGTYKQETTENWLEGIGYSQPDSAEVNIEAVHDNEMNQPFWDAIELQDADYNSVSYPNGFWAGWYDLFQTETLWAYTNYNTLSAANVRYTSLLTVDPLGHCLNGAAYFPQNAVDGRTGVVIAQMFQVFGVQPEDRSVIKNVTFYVMSSNDTVGLSVGQYWTSLEKWPEPVMVKYFLHQDGSLTLNPPSKVMGDLSTSYQYDPSNPQPTNGGNNLPPDIGGDIECGPLDQGAIDSRSDVIVFQTPPQAESSPLYLTGPMFATLFVSSSCIDTDFMVRISDVYPSGEVRLLQDNAIRMRWREATDTKNTPVYMTPGEVYKVEINLWNTSYVLASGHSLRVAISSSNTPRFSVNPNNGLLLSDTMYPGPNITAVNTIYHSPVYPSHVALPVVSKHQLPEVHIIKAVNAMYPQLRLEETLPRYTKTLNRLGTRHDAAA